MRTDHNVIGETHSLLTPLSVRLRGQLTEVLPAQTTAARSETETAWVGRLCADPLRLGCAKARNGCAARATFSLFKTRTETAGAVLVGVSFCEYMIFILIRSVYSRSGSRALRLGCSAFRAPVVPFPESGATYAPGPRQSAASVN